MGQTEVGCSVTRGFRDLLAQFSMPFQFTIAPPIRTDPRPGVMSATLVPRCVFPGPSALPSSWPAVCPEQPPQASWIPRVPSTSAQEEGSPCVLATVLSWRAPRVVTFAVPGPPEKEAEEALSATEHIRAACPRFLLGFHYCSC